MQRNLCLWLFICFIYSEGFSQSTLSDGKFSRDLLSNGVILVSSSSNEISSGDKALMLSYNFNYYRRYNNHIKVQLERGPMIELFSIKELQDQGIFVKPEFIEQKKNESLNENIKHEIILRLNIGMGYRAKTNSEIDN